MAAALLDRSIVRQAVRFCVVGVANTVTCLAIVWSLRDGGGLPVWLASASGYMVATVQSYVVNRTWTFGGGEAAVPVGTQMVRFVALNVLTGLLFTLLTSLLAPEMGVRWASLLALVPVTGLSFLGARFWVFHRRAG
jgi:putative flippase GtrA